MNNKKATFHRFFTNIPDSIDGLLLRDVREAPLHVIIVVDNADAFIGNVRREVTECSDDGFGIVDAKVLGSRVRSMRTPARQKMLSNSEVGAEILFQSGLWEYAGSEFFGMVHARPTFHPVRRRAASQSGDMLRGSQSSSDQASSKSARSR